MAAGAVARRGPSDLAGVGAPVFDEFRNRLRRERGDGDEHVRYVETKFVTGVKSFAGSYGTLLYSSVGNVCVLPDPTSWV